MYRTDVFLSQYCISVGLFCVIIYMYGFFPIKNSTNIFSSSEDYPSSLQDLKFNKEKLYNGSVNKTVLMVIDGIRVDFVTADNMPYTGRMLEGGGEGCQLTARTSAPTVTLPRVKAIVTGAVSSFIDVVLNFGTKELLSDSIIEQASRTKTLAFYGDDTWIKLFPRQFARSEGTTSFYVNDYTVVDNNVTRNVDTELERSDWDVMILHYLGLDHIGHIQGPKSALIQPKLWEMDNIIARIHTYLRKQGGGLLMVCGDHGMKDSGSHGGVSPPEVLVPVIFLGLSCPYHFKEEILQVDLAATLSVLWQVPIPADSMGVVAAGLLSHLTPAQRLYALLYNAQQLADNFLRNGGTTTHESYLRYQEARQRHYEWLSNSSAVSDHQVETQYQDGLIQMSRFLSEVLANYDMLGLYSAMALLFQVVCLLGLRLITPLSPIWLSIRWMMALSTVLGAPLLVCRVTSLYTSMFPISVLLVCVLLTSFNIVTICQLFKAILAAPTFLTLSSSLSWRILLPVGMLLFCISMFSSSLIEEEHQVWYWLWASVATLRLYERPATWLGILAAHRFLRTMNQTGDKWAHLPDLSDWLMLSQNRSILSALCVLSLTGLCWCCAKVMSCRLSSSLCICAALCIYLHKAALQQVITITSSLSFGGVTEARLSWLLIACLLLLNRSLDGLLVCWMLAASLLLRAYNTLLVPSLFLLTRALSLPPSDSTTILYHWIGTVFFFYQGNSNSIASVDVAAGYAGLDQFNFEFVAAMLFIHTYAMPVLAYLLNLHSTVNNRGSHITRGEWRLKVSRSAEMVAFLQLLHVFVCMVVITLHRYHLFVWTVFSPKLLYVGAQTVVYFVLISITNVGLYSS